MSYETTSLSGKFLFHPWALHPLICPIFSEITPVEMRLEDRIADVLARQLQIWKEADFRTFKPKSSRDILNVPPILARTLCGIFAGLFVAPLGVLYHGSMIGKESFVTPGQDSKEKIQKHKEALYTDGAAFVATLGLVLVFLLGPVENLKDLNVRKLLSLCRKLEVDPMWLGVFVMAAALGTDGAVFLRGQAMWKRNEGCLLSKKLHENFGLIGLDGNRFPFSPRDSFFLRDPITGKVDTDRLTWTRYQLFNLRTFMDTECLLAAIEAKKYIDPFPYEYPIKGDKIADLLLKGQEELASRLRKLQYAASSTKDILDSLLRLHDKKIGYKPDIPEDLYRAIFSANSDVAQLRVMGVGSKDWLTWTLAIRDFVSSQKPESWSQFGIFHEKWKELAKKDGKYSGSYPFANFEDTLEYKALSILSLSQIERPEVLIYSLTHSDQNKDLELLGKELVHVLQKLQKRKSVFELRTYFIRLDPEELGTIFNKLDQKRQNSQDEKQKERLANQLDFIVACQDKLIQELDTYADLLPAFGNRWISDGAYIEMLIDLFDKDAENKATDLLDLLKHCQKEYLASKEERDQVWVENFFMDPWIGGLKRGQRILASLRSTHICNFAKGLKNVLNEREGGFHKSGDDGRISYAHLVTGIPRGEKIPFRTLGSCYNRLRESLGYAISATNLRQILEANKAEIILDFYNFVENKVYERFREMYEDEKQKNLVASEVSSSSSLASELD